MTIKKVAIVALATLFAAASFAGEKGHHATRIEVVSDDGGGEVRMVLDSADLGFDLHEMQVGENQSVVDKEGRAVLLTRTEEGFTFDVDGKEIKLPAFDMMHNENVWVGEHSMAPDVDVDVHVIRDIKRHNKSVAFAPHSAMQTDGILIVGGQSLDDATKESIRSTLQTAGHEDVQFVGGGGDGLRQVKVVSKVVEVSD